MMEMASIKNGVERLGETSSLSLDTKDFDPDKRINDSTENKNEQSVLKKDYYNPDNRIDVSEVLKGNTSINVSDNKKNKEENSIESIASNDNTDVKSRIMDRGAELTQEQKNDLLSKGMSPGVIGDCTFKDGVYQLKTSYNKFEGRVLATTGVPYVRKTIDYFDTKLEGVFPKFESIFTAQLPGEKLRLSDEVQFSECVKQLQDALKDNPALQTQFTPRQLEQIAHGRNPGGFTWHHNEEIGKMELVKSDVHAESWHTGGRAIWGGGGKAR